MYASDFATKWWSCSDSLIATIPYIKGMFIAMLSQIRFEANIWAVAMLYRPHSQPFRNKSNQYLSFYIIPEHKKKCWRLYILVSEVWFAFHFVRLQFRHHKTHCQSNPIKSFECAASAEIYMYIETHNEQTFSFAKAHFNWMRCTKTKINDDLFV